MSTILDALRKVERERESPHEPIVHAPTLATETPSRLPMWMVATGAFIGFSAGAVLSWRLVEAPPIEIASLPAPQAPPAIAVPRPPRPAAPDTAQHAAADATAPSAVPPSVRAAPAEPPSESLAIAAPRVDESTRETAARDADRILAAIEKDESVLAPSPFSPPREAPEQGVEPPVAPAMVPPVGMVPAPPQGQEADERLAATAPSVPVVPELEAEPVPELEAEPEPTPEALIDTGRSPPGAPKVALSFLQWSADPARRFAFISVDGAPSQRVREGEVTGGMTIAAITPTGVQLKREGTTFVIRPRH